MKKRVLIIDDDKSLRTILKGIFEDLSYEVFEACNGKDGIESFCNNPTDIVITDIFMPEKGGLETVIEFRRDFPAIKLIAMSRNAIGSNDLLYIAKLLGASYCIKKPFDPRDLIEIVSQLLNEVPAGNNY